MPTRISNENLAALLNVGSHLSLFIWEDAPGWPVRFVSDNIQDLLGYKKTRLESHEIQYRDLINQDDLPRVMEEVNSLLSKESGSSLTHQDYRVKHAKGHDVWVSDTTVLLRYEDGKNHLYGYLIDVTERKQLQIALEMERNRLQLILDATRLGTWEWNPQTGVTIFNQRWASMFGWDVCELETNVESWSSRLHPEDYDDVWQAIKNHLDGVTPFYESLHRIRHRDGHWVYVLDRGKIIERDNQGRAIRYTGTVTDVTEQKKAELNALKAAHAKNVFLANMSHEIRTPLHGILGIASVLESTDLNPYQQQLLGTIKNSGDYLLTTLNDVLDLTQAEEGQLKVKRGVHSPAKVLGHVIQLFEQPVKDKGLEFIIDIDADIPERTLMDRARIAQVISNLVSNALKFTERGSIAIKASWEVDSEKQSEGDLIVKVQDTGVGIYDTQRIWQLFEQEQDGLNRPEGGSGLGLAIVRNLVQLLSGTIQVDSEPEQGSCFTLCIPMSVQSESAHQPEQNVLPKLTKKQVLVVDDNKINQLIIKEMLLSLNQYVDLVSDAHNALKMMQARDYDVLFMDLHMPHMDGMEATRALRDMHIHQPYVIALTADAYPETRTQALRSGMDDYVTKPFVKADIARVLERFDMLLSRKPTD
ncbi:PAS domain S-box-containing protein [Idiomarina loihiensis]|jgi:PAS domain S-box-containing protein|uniref:histidine kinase n=1 Tax=Idiomarina loihiensis (strain ATCC BAA-735 / DSM 15497 / L2-TR) TaxID=283942 RepID=Q5QY34_IDILO|nr:MULTISPECIES: PAS domain-containing protein [Idiomarina]AAV82287.1 Hybrid sensor histidine kinase [Idiomarina loihiensis L2TR]AGM36317.1 hybrid sensor histidine kinase [Idiomarina loihiensis GSL 199]PWW39329.1 PAS domain S-box-containing protein [Idiomarina loihiensis]TDP49576.1 PAS domain S-box-containing protein [Idiomarina loihiensis]TDS24110.1 PAS domain S-box-containing protein [Idiomarina sp. H2]